MGRALTKEEYTNLIVAQLGGSIVDVELEEDIPKFLDTALIMLKPYMNTTRLVSVPCKSCIDLSGMRIYTVVHVFRGSASSFPGNTDSNNSNQESGDENDLTFDLGDVRIDADGTVHLNKNDVYLTLSKDGSWSDDSYLFNPFLINYFGTDNLGFGTGTSHSIAVTMLTSSIYNSITGGSADIDFYQDGDKLYVDVKGGESIVTLQYLPDYQSVSEIDEPYWINYVMRIGLALTKIALGRARTKYNISNLPYEMDGDTILSEGTTELETITDELKSNNEFWYFLD